MSKDQDDFNPLKGYWIVAGAVDKVFSTAVGDYVPISDPTYVAWLATGLKPRKTPSETTLANVLTRYSLRPVNASVLAAYQTAKASALDQIQFRMLFNHENRIRALNSQAPMTQQQFLS